MQKIIGALIVTAAAVATMLAPTASADMRYGNYQVLSDRWTDASWIWAVYPCSEIGKFSDPRSSCVLVSALPSPQFGAYYGGTANLVDGHYSFTTDVPDGLRCVGGALPSRDTYTWDPNTLAGTVESHFDVGCFNGPPGVNTWTFALTRL